MKRVMVVMALAALLIGCENMYEDEGIPRLRTQRDVDVYNATVSSESEKMICTRETIVGTHFREFVCMTQAQRDRYAILARDELENIAGSSAITGN